MAFSWETNNRTNGVSSPKTSADFSWQKPERVVTPQSANLQAQAQIAKNESDRVNSFGSLAKETLRGAFVAPTIDFARSLWNTYEQTPAKLAEDIKSGASDIQQGNVIKGVAKAGLRTAGDAALAIFAPISSALGAVLNATGGQQLQDNVGKVVADASGITDIPAFQRFAMSHPNAGEDFNRILTLFMAKGEKGQIDPARIASEAKTFATKLVEFPPQTPTKLPVTAEGPTQSNVKISTPSTRQADYSKSQGYEPYVPSERLPVIDMGPAGKSALPSIQMEGGAPATKLGSMTVEPIKPQDFSWNVNKPVETAAPSSSTVAPTTVEPILPPREPGVTKTASDINQTLVKQGFEALPTDVQAKYTPQSFKEIADHASTLLDDRLPEFKDMMTGRAPLSLEIQRNPEIYHNTLESYAINNLTPENVQLLQDLAKSPVSQTSRAGQILGGHGFNDNPNSTVKALEGLNAEYKARVEKKTGKQYSQVEKPVIEEAKVAKESVKVTKQTWGDFIESIKCNY